MNTNFLRKNNQEIIVWLIGLMILLPYFIGSITPEKWWGTHFLSFLSSFWTSTFLITSIIVFSYVFNKEKKLLNYFIKKDFHIRNIALIGLSFTLGVLFYQLPIVADYYGNARSFNPLLNDYVKQLPSDFFDKIFSFKFEPGNGRRGVMLLYTLLAYLFNCTYGDIFKWVDAICGAGFVLVWLIQVKQTLKNSFWQTTLIIAGITTPFLLIFFGHIDTYAPLYLLLIVWLFILVKQIKSQNFLLYIPLILLLFIGVRFHTLMYLLLPALALAFAYSFFQNKQWIKTLFTFKGALIWLYTPMCIAGSILYFFVFKDYNDPRKLENFKDIDRLFLPIISPEAPLDHYNLFSWNHILDYINVLFLWSPVLLFLLITIIAIYRKHITKNDPTTVILSLTFLIFSTVLFVFNPLMSMPMDWDLFLFPAPMLMVLLLLLIKQIETFNFNKNILICTLSLAIVSIPIFIVNNSIEHSSYRMESVGKHVFKTYYEHSGTYLLYALQMIPNDPDLYMMRKDALIKDLKPFAIEGKDDKYASLLTDNGIYHLRHTKKYEQALADFGLAHNYYPKGKDNLIYLMETNFILNRFEQAYQNATLLIKMSHPNRQQALQYGIHCALEASYYKEALTLSSIYVKEYKHVELYSLIHTRLLNNDRVADLKLLFEKSQKEST